MKRVHADTIDDKNLRKNEPSKKALSNSNIEQLLVVSEQVHANKDEANQQDDPQQTASASHPGRVTRGQQMLGSRRRNPQLI